MRILLLSLFLLYAGTVATSAQINGIVIDNLTKKPIPYVSIWVEQGNNGTTSEENGSFQLSVNEKSKNLIFSALGYEKKIVVISKEMIVELNPISIELQDVLVMKILNTRCLEIGETESPFLQAYENGPRIDIKYFPYEAKYKKTKFIKQVVINTDCRIEEATLKLHFYKTDEAGLPGEEFLDKDFIVTVNKGIRKTIFNVLSFNLRMPKEGIFVGFERLKIEKNKFEKTIVDANTKSEIVQTSFCPFVLYNRVERDFHYIFSEGKWNREIQSSQEVTSAKTMIYEPSINLILTN